MRPPARSRSKAEKWTRASALASPPGRIWTVFWPWRKMLCASTVWTKPKYVCNAGCSRFLDTSVPRSSGICWSSTTTGSSQALEFKSQVGPSFGNNFNNRTEEAIGTAIDLWTAYREAAFGQIPRPFVGWLVLVEDCEKSRSPVQDNSPHFPVLDEYKGASYADRYDLLCQKLVQEAAIHSRHCTAVASRSRRRWCLL